MSPPTGIANACFQPTYVNLECTPDEIETGTGSFCASGQTPPLETSSTSGIPLSHASGVRLFSGCALPTIRPRPLTHASGILAEFTLGDLSQTCMAQELRAFLEGIGFDEAHRYLHPASYGRATIYDDEWTPSDVLPRLRNSGLSFMQQSAVGFFMYGRPLAEWQINELFSGHEALRDQLREAGIIVAETHGTLTIYRLNNLSLESHSLPNGELMYLFADLPAKYRSSGGREATAQISGTSYILLHRLQQDYENGIRENGVVADMGAGTGIQAIALLMMHSDIEEAISLEIDAHSMNLHRFNAMLNGVGDRLQVVDNSSPEAFPAALAGRSLNLVVSNPPFNTVPSELAAHFTNFGDGGEHGIDITTLFLRQALPHLATGGELILYSQLAENDGGQLFLQEYLEANTSGLNVSFETADLERLDYDRDTYAGILHNYLSHTASGSIPTEDQIRDALRRSSVAALRPYFVRMRATGSELENSYSGSATSLPALEDFYHRPLELLRPSYLEIPHSPGGVRSEVHRVRRGGVYIREMEAPRGGVYLESHQTFDLPRDEESLRRLLEAKQRTNPSP